MQTDTPSAAVFETPLGWCGLCWTKAGIAHACLPEKDADAAWLRLNRGRTPALRTELPDALAPVVDGIRALMAGGDADLLTAELDMGAVPTFEQGVYRACRAIPRGKTLTYGDIAFSLGDVSLSRAVGVALGKNPFPPIVPCHRVLGADGRMVGFSATGGIELKRKLLVLEGALPDQADLFG